MFELDTVIRLRLYWLIVRHYKLGVQPLKHGSADFLRGKGLEFLLSHRGFGNIFVFVMRDNGTFVYWSMRTSVTSGKKCRYINLKNLKNAKILGKQKLVM